MPVQHNVFLLKNDPVDAIGDDTGNILSGNGGNNRIWAIGGDDAVWGGRGRDQIWGDALPDAESGGNPDGGSDTIYAGSDEDTVSGGEGGDWIYGDSGESYYALTAQEIDNVSILGLDIINDVVTGLPIDFTYDDGSTDAADELRGDAGSDTIFGGAGNDTIYGGGIASLVPGEAISEDDVIFGGAGNDLIFGELGNDTIFGGDDVDTAVIARIDAAGDHAFIVEGVGNGGTKLTHLVLNGSVVGAGPDGADVLYDIEYVSFGDEFDEIYSIDQVRAAGYLYKGDNFVEENGKLTLGTLDRGLIITNIASLSGGLGGYLFSDGGDGFITVTVTETAPASAYALIASASTPVVSFNIKANYFEFSDTSQLISAAEILEPTPAPIDDHGDSRANATHISSIADSVDEEGSIESAGDVDYFSFSTTSGRTYGVVAVPNGGAVDPAIRVYNSSGSQVASNTDFQGDPAAALSFKANGGTHYVRIYGEGSSTGDYGLGISDITDDSGDNASGGGSEPEVDIDLRWSSWDFVGTDGEDDERYSSSYSSNLALDMKGDDDYARTGRGEDFILGGDGRDTLLGQGGDDIISGDAGDDSIEGGDGNDSLLGGTGEDDIEGGDGNDLIGGNRHDDTLIGNDGDDTIVGGDGEDSIKGGDGDDKISGGDDEDTIYGNNDDDLIYGGDNADRIIGGSGNDRIYGDAGRDDIRGESGADWIEGGDHDDEIDGGSGNDHILGGAGNDTIKPGPGDDDIDGDSGSDWLDYGSEAGGATINMITEIAFGPGIGFDRFDSIDHITGTDDEDLIIGDNDDNFIEGDGGNDRISGGGGNDSIDGESGADTAVFSGNRSDYSIAGSSSGEYDLEVVDNRAGSPDGTDLLESIAYLEFADVRIRDNDALSTAPTANADEFEIWSDRPAILDVLANDTDPEGDALLIVGILSLPSQGQAYVLDNQIVFDPEAAFDGLAPDERASVEISYRATDGHGWFSEATAVIDVVAPPQPEPTVSITGTAEEDQTLTAEATNLGDPGSIGPVSYVWLRDGVAIIGATDPTHTLTQGDVGAVITAEASWTDVSEGTTQSVTSDATDPVENVNDLPTGAMTISGTVEEGQTLSADSSLLADEDGLGTLNLQWLRDGNSIDGAIGASYNLTQDDVNAAISIQAAWTDQYGSAESVTSDATDPVTAPGPKAIGEVVQLTVGTSWQTLTFANTYTDAVVFALSPSLNEVDAAATRFKNITGTGAEILLQEPKKTVGGLANTSDHVDETVTLLVLEKGTHFLEDGTVIQVGEVETNKLYVKGFETITFAEDFDTTPSIFSQVQTINGTDFITSRQRNPDGSGFQLTMQEEQADNLNHATETVGWFAIEHGSGSLSETDWQAGASTRKVNGNLTNVAFNEAFDAAPLLVASLASYNGTDPASPRLGTVTETGFKAMVLEDQSLDDETQHGYEIIDWIGFSAAGTLYEGEAPAVEPGRMIAASGFAAATDKTVTVDIGAAFDNPVVIATMTSRNGTQEAVARVSNVTATSFDVRIQETDALDGNHGAEDISWIVVEAGTWQLADGTVIQAGLNDIGSTTRQGFASINFAASFTADPAVLTQTQAETDSAFVKTRMMGVDVTGFEVALEEEESASWGPRGTETVGWIAVDMGLASDIDGFVFEAGDISTNHNWKAETFTGAFDAAPGLVAGMATYNYNDTAGTRIKELTDTAFDIHVEEDTSHNAETGHGTETFHWVAFNGEVELWGDAIV